MGTRERAKQVLSDEIGDIAADKALAALTEAANLTIVPANLLDAVIAAVEMTEIPWKESQEWRKKEIIAAIRAAWKGDTDER